MTMRAMIVPTRNSVAVVPAETAPLVSVELFAETHRSADVMLILVIGGVGWLYGGILGAIGFKLLQDVISSITPQYWTFWVGLFLVVLVLVGRDRLFRPWAWFRK
jgi:branched-chain amino acid transport system permease protein